MQEKLMNMLSIGYSPGLLIADKSHLDDLHGHNSDMRGKMKLGMIGNSFLEPQLFQLSLFYPRKKQTIPKKI